MAISISVLYTKSDKRILYAESGKEFVDLLLSLLALPLGHAMNLLKEYGSNTDGIGSITKLYQSAVNFEESMLYVKREDLIIQKLAKPLPLLAANTETDAGLKASYYKCSHCKRCTKLTASSQFQSGRQRSYSEHKRCTCNYGLFNVELSFDDDDAPETAPSARKPGYVKKSSRFIISDDLSITPSSTIKSIDLLNSLNVHTMSDLTSTELTVGQQEVVEIVKSCLISRTVLNDVFKTKLPAVLSESPNVSKNKYKLVP